MTTIKAVVFDCFGVLYQGSLDYLYEITPERRRQELLDVSHSSDFGYIDDHEYLTRVSELVGKPESEVEKFIGTKLVRHPEMFEYIRSLRPMYKTGLLSNVGSNVMDKLFTSAELNELFDVHVFSSEVGMVKPFPEIYEMMVMKLGLVPGECVMIDDTGANVEGAKAIGMEAILYRSQTEIESELKKLGVRA